MNPQIPSPRQNTVQPQPAPSSSPQQPQAALPPSHQPISKEKKMILGIVFGVLTVIVAVTVIMGVTSNKNKRNAPISIIPGVSSAQLKSRDVERETDIKALHGQVEAYWAQYGYYPTLANMNDTTFRSTYLKGLDEAALMDPLGTKGELVSTPTENSYSYEVVPSTCDNVKTMCATYTLTATLEGEVNGSGTFVKVSLNE